MVNVIEMEILAKIIVSERETDDERETEISFSSSVIGGTMHVWKLEGMRMNPKWGYCDYRLVDIYSLTEVRYKRNTIVSKSKIYHIFEHLRSTFNSKIPSKTHEFTI